MKKYITLCLGLIIYVSQAFGQGGQRLTVEERTKATIEKLAVLQLGEDATLKANKVFTDYFTNQQKAMEEMRAAGSFDGEAMRARRVEFANQRDARLKEVLSEAQYKVWIEEIEPSLRPQRRNN